MFFTRVHPHPHPPPPLLAVTHRRPMVSPTTFFSINPSPTLPLPVHANNPRWDSNAETFRTTNFDFNDSNHDFQEQEEQDDDDDDDSNQWLDILDYFIDGPQPFLMALAIPIAQSAFSFLFQTLWGRGTPKTKTRRRGTSKRKQPPPPPPRPPPRGATYVDLDDEQDEYVEESERKRAAGYHTWVAGDGPSDDNKTSASSSTFGGWEELDRRRTRSNKDGNRKQSKGTMSTRLKRSQTPLLLRLLIAVFPFLGSWTKLL